MSAEWDGEARLTIALIGLEGLADASPIFEAVIDEAIVPEVREQLDTQGRGKYPKLSDPYAARKRRLYSDRPILQATGVMYRALTEKDAPYQIRDIGPDEAVYGTSLARARFHQFPKRGSRLPQRIIFNMPRLREKARFQGVKKFAELVKDVVKG